MERMNNQWDRDFRGETDDSNMEYELAYKKVKRIKGFYVHAIVYLLVNAFLIISAYINSKMSSEVFFSWQTYSTALFWGIGLLAHGLSVLGRNVVFGQNWEERKIQEFINKDKSKKWE